MSRKIFEMTDEVTDESLKSEDGGMALIQESYNGEENMGDECLFVELKSWDDDKDHSLMKSLVGSRIRITVEVVD